MYFDQSKEEYTPYKPYSEKTAQKIDEKIKEYMNDCYAKAKDIITKNKKLIDKMSNILLDKEYLTKKEFGLLMDNKPIQLKTKSDTKTINKNKKPITKKQSKKI
jgi:ATP-dependent Zn protease